MCMGCPEGATRDGVICRPMDADGVPDDCDNGTFTLTLIKTCPPVFLWRVCGFKCDVEPYV